VRAAGYKVRDNRPLDIIVSEILGKVRQYQTDRLNIHPEAVDPRSEAADSRGTDPRTPDNAGGDRSTPPVAEGGPQSEAKDSGAIIAQQENKPRKTTYLEFRAPKEEKDKNAKQEPESPATADNKPRQEKKQQPQKDGKPDIKNKQQKPKPAPSPQSPKKPEENKPAGSPPEQGSNAIPTPAPKQEEKPAPEPAAPEPQQTGEEKTAPPEIPDWLKEK
jgi:hypothetical protein